MNYEPEDDYRQEQEAYDQQLQDDYEREMAEANYEAEQREQLRKEAEYEYDSLQSQIDSLYDKIEQLKERQFNVMSDL